jgi:hypothetical protein
LRQVEAFGRRRQRKGTEALMAYAQRFLPAGPSVCGVERERLDECIAACVAAERVGIT